MKEQDPTKSRFNFENERSSNSSLIQMAEKESDLNDDQEYEGGQFDNKRSGWTKLDSKGEPTLN